MKSMIRSFIPAVLGLVLMVSGARAADYFLKVVPDGPVNSYNVGDVITFDVYIDITEAASTGDDTYSWAFSVKFDGNELEWVNPSAGDKGTNITLHIPSDWSAYPATGGSPIFEYTEPNTIVLINAAKRAFPPGDDWHIEGEVLLASFDLKLKTLESQDGLLDVWTYYTTELGEVFGFRTYGIHPIDNAPFPLGGPDFGTGANEVYIKHLGLDENGFDIFPREISEQPYYTAVASVRQAVLFLDPAYQWASQSELYTEYHTGEPENDMSPNDVKDMLNALTWLDTSHPATKPYHFSHISDSDEDMAIKRLIHWIDYDVPGVTEPNAPAHVPTDGEYNWNTVRGFVTDVRPTEDGSVWTIPEFSFYGLWLNDPKESGIGYNIYLTGDEFKSIYEHVDGSYRFVAEPPEFSVRNLIEANLNKVAIKYVRGKINLDLADLMLSADNLEFEKNTSSLSGIEKAENKLKGVLSALEIREKKIEERFFRINWEDIIPAELLASADFHSIFSRCRFKRTLEVIDLNADEAYELVLFGQSRYRYDASVVLLVGVDGAFCRASWTNDDQKYLSKKDALGIARKAVCKTGRIQKILPCEFRLWQIRLVWDKRFDQSKFKPVYEVSAPFGQTVFVMQDGSYIVEGKPLSPVIRPLLRKSSLKKRASRIKTIGLKRSVRKSSLAKSKVYLKNNMNDRFSVEEFKAKTLKELPLLTVQTFEPKNAGRRGCPKKGQVWIRIKPEHSADTDSIMAKVAGLYKNMYGEEKVKIVLLVGKRFWTERKY